jgi:hypothetical protein
MEAMDLAHIQDLAAAAADIHKRLLPPLLAPTITP